MNTNTLEPFVRWECVRVEHRKAFLGEWGVDTGYTWCVEFNDDCGGELIRRGNGDCPYVVGGRYIITEDGTWCVTRC